MGDKESLVNRMNDGRTMSICLQWCEPIFEKRQGEILNSLKSLFRQGAYTEQVLSCHVAQLIALDDLKNAMRSIARSGDDAARELELEGHNDE